MTGLIARALERKYGEADLAPLDDSQEQEANDYIYHRVCKIERKRLHSGSLSFISTDFYMPPKVLKVVHILRVLLSILARDRDKFPEAVCH